jgi:hypothetical protein
MTTTALLTLLALLLTCESVHHHRSVAQRR